MDAETLDISPGPALLESLRVQPHSWTVILGELIDNSLDAGATRVEVKFAGNKQVIVTDDGNGCPDISKMLTLGMHFRQSTTRLGRFGVGLKEAACALWGLTEIESVHGGMNRRAYINWQLLSRKSQWAIAQPTCSPANGSVGTTLRFSNIQKGYPGDYAALAAELGYTFMPALNAGRQIKLSFAKRQPILCRAYQLPPLENVVEATLDVGGKIATIRAGVVQADHKNTRPGFAFVHGHRVIMDSSLGSQGKSTSRVTGIVELVSGWTLSKNKTAIINDEESLGEAIHEQIAHILSLADKQALTLTGEIFTQSLNDRFRAAMNGIAVKTRKAKREPTKETEGAVEPKGTQRTHKRAKRTQPGERFHDAAEAFAASGQINWRPFDNETFGAVDLSGQVIWLNENNKTLIMYRDRDNRDAVLNVALGLFVSEVIDCGQIEMFPAMRVFDNFAQRWAAAMSLCDLSGAEQKDTSLST